MPKFTNISTGPRGIHTSKGLLMVEKGETVDVELAKNKGENDKLVTDEPNPEWFAPAASAAAKEAAKDEAEA